MVFFYFLNPSVKLDHLFKKLLLNRLTQYILENYFMRPNPMRLSIRYSGMSYIFNLLLNISKEKKCFQTHPNSIAIPPFSEYLNGLS